MGHKSVVNDDLSNMMVRLKYVRSVDTKTKPPFITDLTDTDRRSTLIRFWPLNRNDTKRIDHLAATAKKHPDRVSKFLIFSKNLCLSLSLLLCKLLYLLAWTITWISTLSTQFLQSSIVYCSPLAGRKMKFKWISYFLVRPTAATSLQTRHLGTINNAPGQKTHPGLFYDQHGNIS